MAIDARTVVMGGIWANGAPDPPASPVSETTYANSSLTEAELIAGWPYSKIVDSSNFNEVLRRATTLLSYCEQFGILPWSSSTIYPEGGRSLGSNGYVYISLSAANTNHEPTTSPTYWRLDYGVLNYAVATGAVNTYVITIPQNLTAHVVGLQISFKANSTNTGASTININGLGAVSLRRNGVEELGAGNISSGQLVTIEYDGTYYQVVSGLKQSVLFANTTGSSNAYVLTLAPAITAHTQGLHISFKASFTNTGAATININGLGAVAIRKRGSTALVANDIISGQVVTVAYDGSYYQILGMDGLLILSGTDTGAANAYVLTLSPALVAHIVGQPIMMLATNANTGASTININGLGAVAIKKNGSSALVANDIVANRFVMLAYDGTNYQLLTDTTANAMTIHNADTSAHSNLQLTVVRAYESQTSGTNSSQSSGWANVALNTHTKSGPASSSISFSAPSLTLPAGTYLAIAHCPVETGDNGRAQLRLRDTTASITLCVGSSLRNGSDDDFGNVHIIGMFTLSDSHVVALQRYCSASGTISASSSGEAEVYGELVLIKIS